jgi:anti-sigma regulatory factor (Ser/Thr protein kinase)
MVATLEWSHETVLPAESVSASKARDFVCVHLNAHHLRHLVEDVRLVVSELATNAVGHARSPFTVTLAAENGSVWLKVEDESPTLPVRGDPDLMDMSGRGLMLVELLSQEWGTDISAQGMKSVWASFQSRQAS